MLSLSNNEVLVKNGKLYYAMNKRDENICQGKFWMQIQLQTDRI